jgi:hypothetical protein
MKAGWVDRCEMRSIDMREWGFIPPTRLFRNLPSSTGWFTREESLEVVSKILPHWFEITASEELKANTRFLFNDRAQRGEKSEPWTAYIIDRRKKPTVLFAFSDDREAVRARLILGG